MIPALIILSLALLALGIVLCWDIREQQKEDAYRASLTAAQRHRYDVFMRYLPQSEFEADQLDRAIERGEL